MQLLFSSRLLIPAANARVKRRSLRTSELFAELSCLRLLLSEYP